VRDRKTLIGAIVASANQPVFMPPVWLSPEGEPVLEYVDGGVREYAPIQVAIANGADEIYLVLHSCPPSRRAPRPGAVRGLPKVLARTVGLLADEVGQNDLRLAEIYTAATRYLAQIRRNASALGLSHDEVTQLFAGANPFVGRRAVTLHVIRPEEELPTEGLEFDPRLMKDLVDRGRRRAREVVG
jgi:predicted acylesterase/phospholipase RssA